MVRVGTKGASEYALQMCYVVHMSRTMVAFIARDTTLVSKTVIIRYASYSYKSKYFLIIPTELKQFEQMLVFY